ncbi:MAG: primosomal protein N' [Spirochaetales bacterium]|nr:primosomal protein N' [Spirochaetales bacterium]
MSESNSRYIDVVLNVPLNQAFTYREPADDGKKEMPKDPFGYRVEVKFGNRKTTGFVTAVYDSIPKTCTVGDDKIRSALRYIDSEPLLTKELLSIASFMSNYYIAPIGECVFAMIPSGKRETDIPGFSFFQDEKGFEKKELSEEQKAAVEGILSPDTESKFHYLYGTTGSGKTEVFLTCADRVMQEGKGVIYLVPEIGLTPQVVEAVRERFGNTAAVLHSELTPSQRLGEWKRILHKEARVVIGARSAIFAPVPDLGLVIIDEEHDSSYKSGSSPRYHARQIGMLRCSHQNIPLIMGSATPSLEAWHSMAEKKLLKHTLTKRLAGGAVPKIECINLSAEANGENCISRKLHSEISATLKENKQTILFLNRRGFTHFFRCASCGFELKCRNCSVALTYHKSENRLRCHYCGYSTTPPQQCPECGSLDIGYSGFGTEYIESEIKSKFPNSRVMRADTDSLHHKGELQERFDTFKKGEADILLGTQMVAKGLNFPKLKLVGVVLADSSLHLPDFRASEKTFALITQVAGRAGRFFPDGKVIVQTYNPERDAISYAVRSDTEGFYKKEIEMRKLMGFPPFTRLLRLVFRSAVPNSSQAAAEAAAKILAKKAAQEVEILGPAECPLNMVAGNYRWQILLRGKSIKPLQDAAKVLVWGYKPLKDVYIEVDVDPINLM